MSLVRGDFRTAMTCPSTAALVFVDPPFSLGKMYGGQREAVSGFQDWVRDILAWSTAPWTLIVAPPSTMAQWLPRIPPPTRLLWWCKTFAQIRKNTTWQHAVTPILAYARENAPFYFPRGMVPDYIVCGSSMSDIRLIKHHFRGSHPGVTGTPVCLEVMPALVRPGDLVVDPMTGIGSVLVAATRLGCVVTGCEIVEEYAAAAERWLDTEGAKWL